MIKQAGICFILMLTASMAGFGGMLETEQVVAPTKAAAVFFLLLFFVMLYRVLADVAPTPSER
jgi:hypothetical protein